MRSLSRLLFLVYPVVYHLYGVDEIKCRFFPRETRNMTFRDIKRQRVFNTPFMKSKQIASNISGND